MGYLTEVLLGTTIKVKVLILVPEWIIALRVPLLNGVTLVTPLAEPEGRAGEPASFRGLAPPTCVI